MNHNDGVDVLAVAATRARQDLHALTNLRPVPALPSHWTSHGRARGYRRRRLLRIPATAGVLVAVLILGILAGVRLVGDDGRASPQPVGLLGPGDELNGMHLEIADFADKDIFSYCDPIVLQSGTYKRDCAVPHLTRLMIGYGTFGDSPEWLERAWQAERWQLYLDGHEVDLAAFGTKPDRAWSDMNFGEVWVRQWAVTLVNLTPGPHTLRYLSQQSATGDVPAMTTDTTWTFTVVKW